MKLPNSMGICSRCHHYFNSATMIRHIASECFAARPNSRGLHFRVEDRLDSNYWMDIVATPLARISHLDKILRETWLECCRHPSAFRIGSRTIEIDPTDGCVDGLLNRILEPGSEVTYEYDPDDTTELTIRLFKRPIQTTLNTPIAVISRNDSPDIRCGTCPNPAREICRQCGLDAKAWLCALCTPRHPCDPDMSLPIVNSPRVGTCCYTGGVTQSR